MFWALKPSSLGLQVSLLLLFPPHLHTNKTICRSIPLLARALKNACVSISKVRSIPHSAGNFPKDVTRVSSLSQTHTCMRTTACEHSLHVCMLMRFIYLSAEQTTCCVSLVSCVMMMKGTCCSQQKPLSTLRF